MKRLVIGMGAALSALLLSAGPVAAYDYICDDEPPVHVTTPGGTNVTFNNYLSTPVAYRHELKQAVLVGMTQPAADGGTDVTIFVWLPGNHAEQVGIRSIAVRFDATATAQGQWGGLTVLHHHLPIK